MLFHKRSSRAKNRQTQKTLDNLNFKFELGKKYGIIGESGCGKTTLFKLLNGMLENHSGEIEYDGTDARFAH
ncbi:MAG: ATP-binding cassette domain-containing protein [Treponemataceae bacterium]